jgi:acyl-CoA thioester hydrolase
VKRKLTSPPQQFVTIFEDLPKTSNFVEIPLKSEK